MRITPLLRVYWTIPKGPKAPLYRKFKYFNMATPEKYGGSLFKNMLAEAPELFTSCVLVVIAGGIMTYVAIRDESTGGTKNKPYKEEFFVIRPTDPLIETVKVRKAYYEDPMNQPKEKVLEKTDLVEPFAYWKPVKDGAYDGSKVVKA